MDSNPSSRAPWNKGKIVGQKAPFKLKEVWAIRIRLQLAGRTRDLAMFDLGIDSKLRACDLMQLRVKDICHGDRVAARAIVMRTSVPGRTFVPSIRWDLGAGPYVRTFYQSTQTYEATARHQSPGRGR